MIDKYCKKIFKPLLNEMYHILSLSQFCFRLSNGWIIKIGRGLDYFKAPNGKFVLGACDLELRPCLETIIDIFHKQHLKTDIT